MTPDRPTTRWLAALCAALLSGCSLPPLEGRTPSSAPSSSETAGTPLGRAIAPQVEAHPGRSGIHPLADPHDAFAARALLAQAAQRTLDVQYYIWRNDLTGTLLLEALHDAADRGVRVRLLLDDNGTAGLDRKLATLDTHPLIEVRLFNPFVVRRPKAIGYVSDFSRANRRMHNKSFTADNQATIIGGRNVGDEYFAAGEGVLFADLDVLAVGPVVEDVSHDFDRYWASDSAYPLAGILPEASPAALDELSAEASIIESDPAASRYVAALRESAFIRALLAGDLEFDWAATRMVSDDPAKGLGLADSDGLLTHQLGKILGEPSSDVELVSPYFVPTATGTAAFAALADSGVKVRILTNSLDATDVAAVHAGYAKRRKDLLRAGIELYELRRLAENGPKDRAGPLGSSGSSLHAKTFAVDRERVFVGSFNFDPRSANLNTELGFIIDSPQLAARIESMFDEQIPAAAYEVRLSERGRLYWLERRDGSTVRHDNEPEVGFWKRASVTLLSWLPIEWLL
ncbi:phospholipase D family protein [Stutzerimonas stutzeri]|uniref:phospholipase D family protein n=1 Tax=Stutzerimonas stutzeri TaxID=316 RepID=UPI001CFDB934|nr:phospholipase D family protein [Stutzerimonas stutzeri]